MCFDQFMQTTELKTMTSQPSVSVALPNLSCKARASLYPSHILATCPRKSPILFIPSLSLIPTGVCTAIAAFAVNIGVENISGFKFWAVLTIASQGSYFASFLIYAVINAVLVTSAVALTVYAAPAASGSGIAEVKVGTTVPNNILCRRKLMSRSAMRLTWMSVYDSRDITFCNTFDTYISVRQREAWCQTSTSKQAWTVPGVPGFLQGLQVLAALGCASANQKPPPRHAACQHSLSSAV